MAEALASPAAAPAPAPGAPARRLRGALGGSGALWLLIPPITLLILMLVVPLGFLLYVAIDGGGFGKAIDDTVFRESMLRTVLLAFTISVLTLFFGTIYAIALAVAPKWVAVILLICLFTLFWTSLLVRSYGWILLYLPSGPLYDLLHAIGLREAPLDVFQTTLAPYPAMVHVMLPYVVLPVFAAVRQLDPMHLRAARVLGAKPFRVLWSVVLPQLRSGIMAGAVLVFVMSLGFYVTPQLLGSPTAPMVSGLIGGAFNTPGEEGLAAAMSIFLLVIVLVIYAVADRVFKVSEQWGRG
ncbi:ABC transporter permease [Patulibacter defluvii]|uniref:ABC transporter permease n=1 Tax=Patulibacter defluvii TaxID=3095358 RepID=UPI002A75B7B2|nr:ABC transporter permease [Patulibacter sp. DM4]